MDSKKEISIVELMEVDGVRKHILKYVSRFSDIVSLAKTCRCLCFLISGGPIGRDIMSLSDDGYLTIQFKRGLKNAYEVQILKRVNITKENFLFENFEERNRHYVETIVTEIKHFLELAVVFLRVLLRKNASLEVWQKKRNGTIILGYIPYGDNDLTRNVGKIYEFCNRHGVKIKLKTVLSVFGDVEKFVTFASRVNLRFSVNNLITHLKLSINYSTPFLRSIEIFSSYENLEELVLDFYDLNIIDDIKRSCLSNLGRYSLRSCRKLEKLKLKYLSFLSESSGYTEKMLENNLIFIASLMPETVERLQITMNFNLSSRTTDKLNEYMLNIKMLTFYNGEFKDSDCLSDFKNLENFITNRGPITRIPRTIELFVTNQGYFDGSENAGNEIVKKYSKRLLKHLRVTTGGYVFFNDITQWGKYKHVVQKYFY